jgi:DNA-directed RNA polymerase sigma subunit (sigma70/sigma32)
MSDKIDTLRNTLKPHLSDRELTVLWLRNGLDGERLTQKAIGNRFHITGTRVRQIEQKALSKIRASIRIHRLEPDVLRDLLGE